MTSSAKVSVVIPVYGEWDYTHSLLNDIRVYWDANEILIIDDHEDDRVTKSGCKFWRQFLPVKHIRTEKNLGFLLSANFGIGQASGDIIICMDNGIKLYKGSQYGKFWDFLVRNTADDCCVGGVLLTDVGWNNFDGVVFPYLEGWLLSATRRNWGSGFDPRYVPHTFEDVDKSTEWRLRGVRLCQMPKNSVFYYRGKFASYDEVTQKQIEINRKKFMDKWINA